MSENFELLRNVTIGQYIPTGSVIHRLDPRAKIMAMTLFIAAYSVTVSVPITLALTALVLAVVLLSRLPLGYVLRGLLPMLPFLAFLSLLQLIFRGRVDQTSPVLFEWGFLRVTQGTLALIAIIALRMVSFIVLFSLLTLTTTTTHLTHGVEHLLRPLRRFGFPSHEIALVLAIAFRFVPTLAEELDRVAKAQASRLGNTGATNRWRPDQTLRARLPLIVPLFLSALRRGEDLILAMEARGYVSGGARTRLVQLKLGVGDVMAVAVALGTAAAVWWFGSGAL
ncbi:MAG: energy-coupling factor transporter transmembrane component T family protein [Anaerolineales bacterium]